MNPRMVRMPDAMYAEIERIARRDDCSASWIIRRAVAMYLESERRRRR